MVTDPVTVETEDLASLALESWRLDRWLRGSERDRTKLPVRHVARKLATFLTQCGIEIEDPVGKPYVDGLAVETVELIEDDNAEAELIAETISPIVLLRGTVVKQGQVVVRRGGQNGGQTRRPI